MGRWKKWRPTPQFLNTLASMSESSPSRIAQEAQYATLHARVPRR